MESNFENIKIDFFGNQGNLKNFVEIEFDEFSILKNLFLYLSIFCILTIRERISIKNLMI